MSQDLPPKRASHIFDTLREAGMLERRISRHETLRVPMTPLDPQAEIKLSLMALEEAELPTSISAIPRGREKTVDETLDQHELKALLAERAGALDEGPTALSPRPMDNLPRTPPRETPAFERMPPKAAAIAKNISLSERVTGAVSLKTLPMIPVLTAEDLIEKRPDADLILRHPIGEGGTGKVYLAIQRSLGRHVAVKYARDGAEKPAAASMLLHEGALVGHLEHPNIIPVHVLGCDEAQQPVLVMKYVEGVSWATLLKDLTHPFWEKGLWSHAPMMRHLEILLEISKAVEYAHSRGIVHLDIKPDNVMLGEFGEVYLLDWGIARHSPKARRAELTQTLPPVVPEVEGLCGTPMYMAPEMFSDAQLLDERTDIYLLGATLFELLTGHPPHDGQTLLEAFVSAFRAVELLPDANTPQKLVALCLKAMSVSPRDRHQDVQAFRMELIDYLRHRASFKCCEAAEARLQELRELWRKDPEPGAASTHRQKLLQVYAECRFGFRQALQIWDGNAKAHESLEEAVRLMFAVEFERRDLEAAAALLEELPDAPQSLRDQLDALRRLLVEEQKEQAHLRQMQRELDASVAQRQRVRFLLTMGAVAGVFAMLRFVWGAAHNYQRAIAFSVLTLVFALGFLFRGRKELFQNELNRRFTALIMLCIISVLVHRVIRASLGHPLNLIYATDLLMLAWIFLTATLTWRLWLGSLAAVYILGAALAFWLPASALYVMTVCVVSGWLLCAYFWVWEQKQQLYES